MVDITAAQPSARPRASNPVPSFIAQMKPLAAAMGLGLGIGFATAASAATFTVTNLLDSGAGSLRKAVLDANELPGADTIVFQAGLTGTISLLTQILVTDAVTITGPGAAVLTIAPSGTDRALYIGAMAGLKAAKAHARAHGRAQSHAVAAGGGMPVTISGLTFKGNGTATVDGAAIANGNAALTIQNSIFTGNATTLGGGAISSYNGDLTIQSSTLSGNSAVKRGGAIYFYTGTLSIDSSTLSGNQSAQDGGAIAFYGDGTTGTLAMTNSTLSGNKATGTSGRGGAIFLYRSSASTITNSTISGNTSSGAGGGINLYKAAPLTMSNSTMSGNTAAGNGGAVYLYTSTLNLASTIVANSVDRVGTRDIFDATLTTVNADHSLIQNGLGFIVNTGTANIIGQNPLLGPLANNGGPTQTHALLTGSPAIDTGSNPLTLSNDQRGAGFGRTFNGTTDIGAFEVQAAAPPLPPQLAQIPTLSQWGLAILGALTAGVAFLTGFGRRRRD